MGWESSHMGDWLSQNKSTANIKVFHEKFGGTPGVRKSNPNTFSMAYAWNNNMCADKIRFSDKFFTCTANYTPNSMKSEFRAQLENFHEEGEGNKRVLCGKGGGNQDDLLISVIQGHFWLPVALQHSRNVY